MRNRGKDGQRAKKAGNTLFAGILCFCAIAAFCAGCGKGSGNTADPEPAPTETESLRKEPEGSGREMWQGEVDHIVMTYQTLTDYGREDLEEVLAAVNAITVPEIGVEVEFKTVNAIAAFTEYPLWLSRGERIDLMVLNYQDITTYISRGMLLPIDGLLEALAPDIRKVMEEGYYLTEASIIGGRPYGVTAVADDTGSGAGLWIPLRMTEEAGIDYGTSHIYTLEELSVLFGKLKALYPETYPLGQITTDNTFSTYTYYRENIDSLGGDVCSGILTEGDRVVDFFEIPEYYEFLCYLREWYLADYIYPDAAITDAPIQELAESGIVLSCPLSSSPRMALDGLFGETTVCLRTSKVTSGHQYAKSGFWTIPVTSGNPEAAMRFLNCMYGNSKVSNLIQWGIEGKHYVVIDEESRRIAYTGGDGAFGTGYSNPLGLYGDRRKMYTTDTEELIRAKEAYTKEALENGSSPRDFIYDTGNVDRELSAVQKVVEKYVPILESGSVDIDVYYPEFIARLKLAGIDKIIEDKQEQYDRWRAKEGGF